MAENLVMLAWFGIGLAILAFILRTVSFQFSFDFKTNFTYAFYPLILLSMPKSNFKMIKNILEKYIS